MMRLLILALFCFVSCISQRKSQKLYTQVLKMNQTFDAVIVPGLAFNSRNWGELMRRRVIWSWVLYKNGVAKNIIFSGGAVYTPYKEALVMGLYAQKLGVPKANIFYDTIAEHSTENVYYSYLIARQMQFRTLALCTDQYQSSFLSAYIRRRFESHIQLLPVVRDSINAYADLEPLIKIDKAIVRDSNNFKSIRERQAFIYRLKGTFGRNIPWHKYPNGRMETL